MPASEREKWDTRHRAAVTAATPARVLEENAHLLPASGKTLDLACGSGANALWLARRGYDVSAWDFSSVAIEKVAAEARRLELAVTAEVRDVVQDPPAVESFDVIVVTRFLERSLTPRLIAALYPNGLLYYQTFTAARVDDKGPANPAYLLQDNELLALFSPLRILVYREEGCVGRRDAGWRGQAMLVGQKRSPR